MENAITKIEYTDGLYDALKTMRYAIKNDKEDGWPDSHMARIHYRIACEALEVELEKQGVLLPF